MKKKENKVDNNLQKKAKKNFNNDHVPIENLSGVEVRKLAHELHVYQVELEMQNDELRKDHVVIRELQKKYSVLYDFAPHGYLTLSENGKILNSNFTAAQMLGMEIGELIKKPLSMFVFGVEDIDILYLYIKEIIENGRGNICKIKIKNRKNGEYFYAKLEGKIAQIHEGKTKQLWLMISDITKEEEANAHIKILSKVIEQSRASVFITNREGNIEYVNPQFTKQTGYSKDEVIGKNPRILKSGMQPYDVYVKLWSTIIAGHEWNGRFCNKNKKGELYYENISINPIVNEIGNITHFVAFMTDHMEHIKAEEFYP